MIRPFITPAFQPDNTSNTTANRNAGFIPYCCNQKDVPELDLAIVNILSQLMNYSLIYFYLFMHLMDFGILNFALYIFFNYM